MQVQDESIKLVVIYNVLLSLVVFSRDIVGFTVPKYVIIAVCVFFMAFASHKQLVYMVVFTIPFLCGLPGTYIMLIALILYAIKRKKFKSWIVLVYIVLVLLEFCALIFVNFSLLITSIQYLTYLGLILFMAVDEEKGIDNSLCIKLFNISTFLVCLFITIMAIKTAPDNWRILFSNGWYRVGDTQMEQMTGMRLVLNANSMAFFCIVGISNALLLLSKAKGKYRILYVLEIVGFIGFAIFTNSRSFFMAFVLIILLYAISQAKNPRAMCMSVFAIIAICCFVGIFLKSNPYIMEGILGRLNDSTVGSAGGRTELFTLYLEKWSDNIRTVLFGAGVSGYREVFQINASIHNGTAQIFICNGIVGGIALLATLAVPLKEAMMKRVELIFFLPIISVIIFTQTIQFLNPCFLMLTYIVGAYALNEGATEKCNTLLSR